MGPKTGWASSARTAWRIALPMAFALQAVALPWPAEGATRPHLFQKDACPSCHVLGTRPGTFVRPDAFRRPIDTLCFSCHEQELLGVGHRVGMVPTMRVPQDFHLDAGGRLTCASCHDPHADDGANPFFLRRPPGESFCRLCHPGGLPSREPPAVTVSFPPEGAALASGTVLVAGRVATSAVTELLVRSARESVTAPVVRGGFAARVRLAPGPNRIDIEGDRSAARLNVSVLPGAPTWSPHVAGDLSQCETCHPGWESAGFFLNVPSAEACYRCHPRFDTLPHTHAPALLGDCAACHDPHGAVVAGSAARPAGQCQACHDRRRGQRHLLAVNAGNPAVVTACVACHDPHQSTRPSLVRRSRDAVVLSIALGAPEPELRPAPGGETGVEIPGFTAASGPGRPRLPERIVSVAVPHAADPRTARLSIVGAETVELPGAHAVAPVPPTAAYASGRALKEWGRGRSVRNGRDRGVYGRDAPWPRSPLEFENPGGLRGVSLVRLAFRPVQYNPVRGTLTLTRRLVAEVRFAPSGARRGRERARAHPPAVRHAELGVLNAAQADGWAAALPGGVAAQDAGADYLIVTTRAIAAASGALQEFVAHKALRGLAVRTVTEDDFGGAASGQARAREIRRWLQQNAGALGARYLLLIGDPHPDAGDVPMLRSWPRRGATTNVDFVEAPTDAAYADLSGNWDLDGDGYPGEFAGDTGSGGADVVPELFVGRIPVYGSSAAPLDAILRKTISYESDPGDLSWRRAALLPMSFSDASTDGAWLAEQMKSDYLVGRGFVPWTLYQRGGAGGPSSLFTPDAELRGGAVQALWGSRPFGIVAWWGHGSASRTLVGYSGAWDGELLAAPASGLSDAAPALVFQTACLNGFPETEGNLGYALLRRGAVATVAATRASWYFIGQRDFRLSASNAGIGYQYLARLTAGDPAGKALALAKGDPGVSCATDTLWMNLMDFNLYGDPSVSLFSGPALQLSSTALRFLAAEGETEPLPAALAVTATVAPLSFAAVPQAPWISCAPSGGQTPANIVVHARAAGLPAGVHASQVLLLADAAANGPVSLPVTLTVARPGAIAGRVRDPQGAGIPGATVNLQGPRSRAAATDASGGYSFTGLPPGSYTASVAGTGFVFAPASGAVALAEGESRALNFTAASFEIRGKVLKAGGGALAKAAVRLYDESGVLLRQVLTARNGGYAIRKLGPGTYRVKVRRKGWRFQPASMTVSIAGSSRSARAFTGRR